MSKLKVAVIIGSNRRESVNRKLAEALVRLVGDRMEPHSSGSTISHCTIKTWKVPVPRRSTDSLKRRQPPTRCCS